MITILVDSKQKIQTEFVAQKLRQLFFKGSNIHYARYLSQNHPEWFEELISTFEGKA